MDLMQHLVQLMNGLGQMQNVNFACLQFYARICVNVEVNIVLPTFVTLKSKFGKWVQPLEYERAMVFYQGCNEFGNLYDACNKSPLEPKIHQIKTQMNAPLKDMTLMNLSKEFETSTPNKELLLA